MKGTNDEVRKAWRKRSHLDEADADQQLLQLVEEFQDLSLHILFNVQLRARVHMQPADFPACMQSVQHQQNHRWLAFAN